ncbi:hypothetical protein [Alicycliphilus denitrificans]|uniref:hypothetical protein n=1 Tax=Alicycliphilus denitrificans TaxID=179636 RepID=UPI000C9F8A39|nr:hypothetical protein [Alicycliphilus denitrificans]
MLQELIVVLIVAAAVAYVAWRYLPAAWRQRLGRVHPSLAQGPGGCGSGDGCSSCGGCSAAQGPAAEPPVQGRAERRFHASK